LRGNDVFNRRATLRLEKNVGLGDAEEELLVDMLKSRDDPQKLEKTFSEKTRELRINADAASNPIKQIKYRDAAEAVLQSKKDEVEEGKPILTDLSLLGVVTFIVGLFGTTFGSAKLFFEYKKSKLDLEVAKARGSL